MLDPERHWWASRCAPRCCCRRVAPTGTSRARWASRTRTPSARPSALVAGWLDELPEATGVPWEQTVLGGFSQGAVMTLRAGARRGPAAPAALIALSGFIPTVPGFELDLASRQGLPVAIGHGTHDPVISVAAGRRRDALLRRGLAGADSARVAECASDDPQASRVNLESWRRARRRRDILGGHGLRAGRASLLRGTAARLRRVRQRRQVVVLMPGLLLSRKMQDPLARAGRARAPGAQPRPARPRRLGPAHATCGATRCRSSREQVVALLDHLELDEAVVGGTSLGANVDAGGRRRCAPERMRGLLIEMPVLDNALLGCAIAFTPLLVGLPSARRSRAWSGRATARVPRGLHNIDGRRSRLDEPGPGALGGGAPGHLLRPLGAAALRAQPTSRPARW